MACQERAPHPGQRPSLARGNIALPDPPHVPRLVLASRVGAIPDLLPVGDMGLDPAPKGGIFPARAWQHGEESPAAAGDVVQGIVGTELGVRDVEEVHAACEFDERVPGFDVRRAVVPASRLTPKPHRHMAVAAAGEHVEELLQVRPTGLRVPEGDEGRGLASNRSAAGRLVLAAEADGGRVVVEALEGNAEAFVTGQRHLGDQRAPVGIEEPIEGPAQAIVSEEPEFFLRQAQIPGPVHLGHLLLPVEGLALDEKRAKQDPQTPGVGDPGSRVGGGHEAIEECLETEAFEEVVDEGQGAEATALQAEGVDGDFLTPDHSAAKTTGRPLRTKLLVETPRDHDRRPSTRAHRSHPGRDHVMRVRELGIAHTTHDAVREAELPLRQGPRCASWALLRVGSHGGRAPGQHLRVRGRGRPATPSHAQPPPHQAAPAPLGARKRARHEGRDRPKCR